VKLSRREREATTRLTSLLQLAFNSLADALVLLDREGEPLLVNPAAARVLGGDIRASGLWPNGVPGAFSADEERRLSPEELPAWRAKQGEAVHDKPLFLRNSCLPGGTHVLVSGIPLFGADQVVEAVLLVVKDATPGRRTEQELGKANAFLHSIVENLPAMIFVKEVESLRFELFNRAGEELLGFSRDQLLGKNDFDFFPAEQAEFFQDRDRQTLNSGRLVDISEEPIQTRAGERWLHTRKIPICDAAGKPRYLLGISEDITERKHAAELLRKANEGLEQRVIERTAELTRANAELLRQISDRERAERNLRQTEQQLVHAQKMEAIGRLAGGVAHDFNNMLSAILGHVGLALNDVSASDPLREDLEQIKQAAGRATSLTQQLLAYSRRQTIQPRVIDVNALILDMQRLLKRVIGEDVELVVELAPEPLRALLDPSKIQQALLDLAGNAREAMLRGGRLRISSQNVDLPRDGSQACSSGLFGRHVMISVSDTGTGLDSETQSRIFEPFFSTKDGERGSGLGLSTVYGIVVQSGGHISVASETGRGTTFKLYFPAHPGSESSPPSRPIVDRARSLATILLVEDEAIVRRAAVAILRRKGYSVLEASNGKDALALVDSHPEPIQLVITDVVMPGMSGRDLVLRLNSLRPEIAILYMSGYTANIIGTEGVIDADMAFIQKPFTPETLLDKVHELLTAT
jgi:PAS domain S-box-containing protein